MVCEIIITLANDTEWADATDLVQSVRSLPGMCNAEVHPDSLHLRTDFDPAQLSWDRLRNEVQRKGYQIAWTDA